MTTPLPAQGSTDWYGWATQVDQQGRAVAGKTSLDVVSARYDEQVMANSRAAGRGAPPRRGAVTTPTITTSASLTTGVTTPHYATDGKALDRYALNPEFSLVAGSKVGKFGNVGLTNYMTVKSRYSPPNSTTFGSLVVEFMSDAPFLSFYEFGNDAGHTKISVNGNDTAMWGGTIRSNTAQAGAASSITLDTGASAVNQFYKIRWVRITGGTGVGQVRQITDYVGSTRVATINQAWTVVPDSTSTFSLTLHRVDAVGVATAQYINFDWSGERVPRTYRVEISNGLWSGVWTSPIDIVTPTTATLGPRCVGIGDSTAYGLGGTGGIIDSSLGHACRLLGWNLWGYEGLISGTGYLNDLSGGSLTARDRALPPYNSWALTQGGTAGTFTLTWNGITTAAIAYNATAANIQSAVDTAFGTGVFSVYASGASSNAFATQYLLGRGSAASSVLPMTADFTNTTGGWKLIERWSGTVAPYVPRDITGAALPFNIVFSIGTNDLPAINAAYTSSAVYTAVRQLLLDIAAAYPTARVWVINIYNMAAWPTYSAATPRSGEYADLALAIRQACVEVLPKIRGQLPLIEPFGFAPVTTLSAATVAGATSITTPALVPAGQTITIDTGGNAEVRTVTSVSGTGPYTLVVPALANSHASGAAVTGGTTLSASVAAGTNSITTPVPLTVGQHVVLGSGSSSESRTVTAVSGSGPYTATVAALAYSYNTGDRVLPFTSWFTGTGYLSLPANDGAADVCRDTDRLHPTPPGHFVLGTREAQQIDAIQSGVAA